VDSLTRLVLVNAIYFKGNWNKQFEESATEDAQFRLNKVKLLKGNMSFTSTDSLQSMSHGMYWPHAAVMSLCTDHTQL